MIEEIVKYNHKFVANCGYIPYEAEKYPRKKLAILACMDTRLVELLPAALGLKNGDVKMIKNAGGMVLDPYDTTIRSLLVAVLELNVREIMVIAHTDCGVKGMKPGTIEEHLEERGVTREAIHRFLEGGHGLSFWFKGFSSPEASVRKSLKILRNHPLMPADIVIDGFVMDVHTGKLNPVL
ncbi:MAG: carbonic anhydrase [Clostridium sp.]|nr:carbonic anhydrase [Clostridium sp.]